MRISHLYVAALCLASLAAPAGAQTLYGATAANTTGQLVILNPATGAVLSVVGPTIGGGNTYGITALAYNPTNGLLYGSSARGTNYTAATTSHLVTINPATGAVTDIGSFDGGTNTMTDLAFSSTGQLFGIGSNADARLFSINIATGAATAITPAGQVAGTVGGALSFHPTTGTLYASPLQNFGTYNTTTGAYTSINAAPTLPGGNTTSSLSSFDFNSAGVLFGTNLTQGGGGASRLVTVDIATGAVTNIGTSLNGLDAIAFVPVPEPGLMLLAAGPVAFALSRFRRK